MYTNQIWKTSLIGSFAWSILMLGHELIGHGGAVLLIGAKPISVNAMYFYADLSQASFWAVKWVKAAGSLVNILFFLAGFIYLGWQPKFGNWWNYGVWILALMNAFQAGAYIAWGPLIHPQMDWAQFLIGLPSPYLWRLAEWILGLSLYGLGLYVGTQHMPQFIVSGKGFLFQKLRLLLVPWLSAILWALFTTTLMPEENISMMLMGAFGNSFIFMLGFLLLILWPKQFLQLNPSCQGLPAKFPWLLGLLCFLAMVLYLVIAPGIRF